MCQIRKKNYLQKTSAVSCESNDKNIEANRIIFSLLQIKKPISALNWAHFSGWIEIKWTSIDVIRQVTSYEAQYNKREGASDWEMELNGKVFKLSSSAPAYVFTRTIFYPDISEHFLIVNMFYILFYSMTLHLSATHSSSSIAMRV